MGDPKKQRKKYSKPSHPWLAERIEEDKALTEEYGLKNKKEIWKAASLVRNFSKQAKKLIVEKSEHAKREEAQLLNRLKRLGLAAENVHLEDILGLKINDILNRRLQTMLFKKGLVKSVNQARQFIIHGHVSVGNKKITIPGFLVPKDLEPTISFAANSPLFREDHPERIIKEAPAEKKKQDKKAKAGEKPTSRKKQKPQEKAKKNETKNSR